MSYIKLRHGDDSLMKQVWPSLDDECKQRIDKVNLGTIVRALHNAKYQTDETRAMSVGVDAQGGYIVPEYLAAGFIDALVEQSAVMRAGGTMLPLTAQAATYKYAQLADLPSVIYPGEGTTGGDTDFTLSQVSMTPYTARITIPYTVELLEDSQNIEQVIQTALRHAFSNAIDHAVLVGSTAATQPTGILKLPSTTLNSTEFDLSGNPYNIDPATQSNPWYHLCGAMGKLRLQNVMPESVTGMVMHPNTWSKLEGYYDINLQHLPPPPLLSGIRRIPSNQLDIGVCEGGSVASSDATSDYYDANYTSILMGNWNDVVIGVRQQLRLQPLRELYMPNYQLALQASMRFDYMILHYDSLIRLRNIYVDFTT